MNRQEQGEALSAQVEEAFLDLEEQLSLGHTDEFVRLLEFYSHFRSFSIGNIWLILAQRPSATRCMGYRQWEKIGYQVKRGERAIFIRAPWMKKETDQDSGEIRERLLGWIAVPVFAQDQLVGDPELPTPRHELEGDYSTFYDLTRIRIASTGVMVDEEPLPFGVHGVSMAGRIVIAPQLSKAEKCLTAWHELSHQLMEHHNRHKETTKGQRELIAEATSFIVARMCGLDNPFSRDYITHWKGSVTGLHENLTEIHTAVKKIMELLYVEPAREVEHVHAA